MPHQARHFALVLGLTFSYVSHAGFRDLSEPVQDGIRLIFPYKIPARNEQEFRDWYNQRFCLRSKPCFPRGTAKPEKVYAEFKFNSLDLDKKVAMACTVEALYSELGKDSFSYLGTVESAKDQGELVFRKPPDGSPALALQDFLKGRGYTDNYAAGGRGKTWGLRSPNQGAYLHIYEKDGLFYAHIDYANPGANAVFQKYPGGLAAPIAPLILAGRTINYAASGLDHTFEDLTGWDKRYPAYQIVGTGGSCGLGAPEVEQVLKLPTTNKSELSYLKKVLATLPRAAPEPDTLHR